MSSNKLIGALASCALLGCGVPEFHPAKVCEGLPVFSSVEAADQNFDCERASYAIDMSRSLLEIVGIWEPGHRVPLALKIHDVESWGQDGATLGDVNLTAGIDVGSDMRALLHEELHVHVWDQNPAKVLTTDHDGWDTNGYYLLGDGVFTWALFGADSISYPKAWLMPDAMKTELRAAGYNYL